MVSHCRAKAFHVQYEGRWKLLVCQSKTWTGYVPKYIQVRDWLSNKQYINQYPNISTNIHVIKHLTRITESNLPDVINYNPQYRVILVSLPIPITIFSQTLPRKADLVTRKPFNIEHCHIGQRMIAAGRYWEPFACCGPRVLPIH